MTRTLRPYQPKPRYIPKTAKHEQSVQKALCSFLRLQYPDVIYRSDYASGIKLTINQAMIHRSLQSSRAWVDLFIYKPMYINGVQYAGCAIEVKREGVPIYISRGARKGQMVADPHIREQALMIKELNKLGYYATFGVGLDQCINIASWYLSGGKKPLENTELF